MNQAQIGETAGKVWHTLHDAGALPIPKISSTVGTESALTYLALGWLARENKIQLERRGKQFVAKLAE